ncbi:hypothetical protein Q8A67_002424 [Cirrhinus molitorella]|uniref:Uncharacterized protein n=1 Tax=Cirrhinus molitorella TaxID=172907 RepID=A0AA88QCR7_9TELE|nr:hypothetical protein Q8A67_002424 [Cirrhinus molitorella]
MGPHDRTDEKLLPSGNAGREGGLTRHSHRREKKWQRLAAVGTITGQPVSSLKVFKESERKKERKSMTL